LLNDASQASGTAFIIQCSSFGTGDSYEANIRTASDHPLFPGRADSLQHAAAAAGRAHQNPDAAAGDLAAGGDRHAARRHCRRQLPDHPALGDRRRNVREPLGNQPLELAGPKFTQDGQYEQPPRSDWSQRADDKLLSQEIGQHIDAAVRELPDDYRTVFLLKDVDGLSNEEIADALDLTVPAVKSRLHRARLALREKLGEFFEG
jgi:RNA polymerase sigma factor (sigma-70 family)